MSASVLVAPDHQPPPELVRRIDGSDVRNDVATFLQQHAPRGVGFIRERQTQ
jgi:hypothetical protein